jgi:hypothetical protein
MRPIIGDSSNRRRRQTTAWMLALGLCAANLALHLQISALCDTLYRWIGRVAYEWITLVGIGGLTLLAAAPLLRRRRRDRGEPRALFALLILGALGVAAQESLLVSNVELIHFPQFALLTALLLATGLGAEAAWLLGTLAGIADEAFQYLVLYAGLPNIYLDFNDMVLNALGAAYAVCLFAAARGRSARMGGIAPTWRRRIMLALAVCLAAAAWLDPPQLDSFWKRAATGRPYHVLSAPEALLITLLLWLLVAWFCWGGRRREQDAASDGARSETATPGRAESAGSCGPLLLAIAVLASVTGRASPARPTSKLPSQPFLITFWCGPPPAELDDRRAEEISGAGFTVIGAPCEGLVRPADNKRALDVAARHGLAMWIKDERLNGYHPLAPRWRLQVARAVEDYANHPALAGYYLVDEPDTARFPALAALVRRLRVVAPQHLGYINLYPNYAPPEFLGAPSYAEYVERFLSVVRPELLSYDHYPFMEGKDRPGFFANLWTIRTAAIRHDVPFMLIVLAMPHASYRDPTEAELAWQVFHALAFGARGISYFTYWTPGGGPSGNKYDFRYGLIEDGKPTLHYFQAARINRTVAAIGAALAPYTSWGVLDSMGEIAAPLPYGPLRAIEGGPVTAGVFIGPNAEVAFLLVNRDYRYGVDAVLRLQPGVGAPAIFDPVRRLWSQTDGPIDLEPGGARLVRWGAAAGG